MDTIESLSLQDFEAKLAHKKPFTALTPSKSLLFVVKDIQPLVGVSPHSGHHFREELQAICNLGQHERFFEEDSFVEAFIEAFPIQVIARDSRYEYDLNRSEEKCIYQTTQEAWGKTPWKRSLEDAEKKISVDKYKEAYAFIGALFTFLHSRFPKIFVLDQHSYNFRRHTMATPTFDILTHHLQKQQRWFIEEVRKTLSALQIPGVESTCEENKVFPGIGHFSKYFHQQYPNSLCLTVEIKKVFMDEIEGKLFPEITKSMSKIYSDAMIGLAKKFLEKN